MNSKEMRKIAIEISKVIPDDRSQQYVIFKTMATLADLAWAVNRAGGEGYSIEELQNITAFDLIAQIAPNGISFFIAGRDRFES